MITLFENTPIQIRIYGELSYFLIPLSLLSYYFIPYSRPILLLHMIIIGIIGILDTYNKFQNNSINIIQSILSVIIHFPLIYVIKDLDKFSTINKNILFNRTNTISILLLLLANIIMKYLYYWPYQIERNNLILIYNSLYIYFAFIFRTRI